MCMCGYSHTHPHMPTLYTCCPYVPCPHRCGTWMRPMSGGAQAAGRWDGGVGAWSYWTGLGLPQSDSATDWCLSLLLCTCLNTHTRACVPCIHTWTCTLLNRPILVPSGECPGLIQSLGKCWQPARLTAQSSSGKNKVGQLECLHLLSKL